MSNPALSRNPAFSGKTMSAEELREIYDQPAAGEQRTGVDGAAAAAAATATATHAGAGEPPVVGSAEPMTYNNVSSKTIFLFLLVLGGAIAGWAYPILMLPGLIVGLVLGLVNAFKREPSPVLIMLYALAQGMALGAISMIYNEQFNGIVLQAVLGTFSVFGVTLLLFRSGKVRTSPRATKIFMVGMIGYLVFSLLNVVLVLFGLTDNPWGLRAGWLGVVIGLIAVGLAAYSLVMDFEMIKNGVENRIPERWGWTAAFGLTVTLIWLYLEILRILAILRGNN